MYWKLPWRMEFYVMQRRKLPHWPDLHVSTGWTETTWACCCILWSNTWIVSWSFTGILLKIWSEPSILEVNIIWCTSLWYALHKICTIWGYFTLIYKWNCGKLIIKQHMELSWDTTSFGLITRATEPARNGDWPRYTPERERGSHLGNQYTVPCNIEPNT